jgi:hypothetical protein
MREKMFDEAWAAIRKFGGSTYTRAELARATEKTHSREALETYEQSVEQLVNTSSYDEAAKLVARMVKLRGRTEQTDYLVALKERHRRKRNFTKLLG